jgi:hypothetical protein
MSPEVSLPHLFGRFTAVMREHQDLGRKLGLVREMCSAIESNALPLRDDLGPESLLSELHGDLTEHFALEEADDYFGTVVDEDPTLSEPIEALKAEHAVMLERLEGLLELAGDALLWAELPLATRGLLGQLEHHERSESALLRQLFFPQRG